MEDDDDAYDARLGLLSSLPHSPVATPSEVLNLVGHHHLDGMGIGYVDAQLLAATRLEPGTRLWTNDKRLATAAWRLTQTGDLGPLGPSQPLTVPVSASRAGSRRSTLYGA